MSFGDRARFAENQEPRVQILDLDSSRFGRLDASPTSGMQFRQVTTPGPFKQISVPSNWRKFDDAPAGLPRCYHSTFINPSHPDVAISLDSYGLPSGPSGLALEKLVTSSVNKYLYSSKWEQEPGWQNGNDRERAASQAVHSLVGVLDPGTVGDNQFTNPHNPRTHLDKLQVISVGGRSLLSAEGYYVDSKTGHPEGYFSTVYVPVKVGAQVEVHTMSYTAQSYEHFTADKPMFQNTVASIQWDKSAR